MPLMDIFKKKKPAEPAAAPPGPPPPGAAMPPGAPPAGLPVDHVVAMKQQGASNEEISQTLQQQGFSTQQIYDAMSQAEIKPREEPFAMPGPKAQPGPPAAMGAPPMGKKAPAGFEELAESIIEEKWHELTRDLDKINEWKELTSSRMDKVDQNIADMKADLDNLHKAIVSKIGEYDKNLLDVGTEIKAMEKVFQKVLPELTDTVAQLSSITKTKKASEKKAVEKKAK